MNFNAIIAVLVIKGILTRDEADALVSHINDKPQSTVLSEVLATVSEVIGVALPTGNIMSQMAPVGPEQRAEEIAAQTAPTLPQMPVEPVAEPEPAPEPSVPKVAEDKKPASDEPVKPTDVKKPTDKPVKK